MKIKTISGESITQRINLYNQLFDRKAKIIDGIVVTDKVKDILKAVFKVLDIAEKDKEQAAIQLINGLLQFDFGGKDEDDFFDLMVFLRAVYGWQVFDFAFELLSDYCPSQFAEKIKVELKN